MAVDVSIPFRGLVVFSQRILFKKFTLEASFNPLPRISGFLTHFPQPAYRLCVMVSIPFRGLVVFSPKFNTLLIA